MGFGTLSFCHNIYSIFENQVFSKRGLDNLELPNHEFTPGEANLKSIRKELEHQSLSTSSCYEADGKITNTKFDCEMVLLETTGPHGLNNKDKETKDYFEATYDLLTMIHSTSRRYKYVDIKLFKRYKVCFVQAVHKKIRI
ncbi:unnamed protein product [Rhizopus stolonifer]